MPFFVSSEQDFVDHVTENFENRPEAQDRLAAISELRDIDRQGLSVSVQDAARNNGFFRVASISAPLESLLPLLDPEWMKNKRAFYQWLDRHPKSVTYDRRKDPIANRLTLVDGKVVL